MDPVTLHTQLMAAVEKIERHGWTWAKTDYSGYNRHGQYTVKHMFLTRPFHNHAVQVSQNCDTGVITVKLWPNHSF